MKILEALGIPEEEIGNAKLVKYGKVINNLREIN